MSTLDSELSNILTPDSVEVPETQPETVAENVNQPPDVEEILDWTKDKRAMENGMWYNPDAKAPDPNRLYKSYKQSEPIWETLGKHGIREAEKLNEALMQFKELSSTEHPAQLTYNHLNSLLEHPRFGQKVSSFFEELGKEIKREQYGADLPQDILQKLDKVDLLEKQIQQKEQMEQKEANLRLIEQNLDEIDKFAKEYQLDYNIEEFIAECSQNNIPIPTMVDVFKSKSLSKIIENSRRSEADKTLQNIQKNQAASVPSSQRKSTPPAGKKDLSSSLDDVLGIK